MGESGGGEVSLLISVLCDSQLFDRSSNESCSQKQEGLSMDTLQHPVNQTQFGN